MARKPNGQNATYVRDYLDGSKVILVEPNIFCAGLYSLILIRQVLRKFLPAFLYKTNVSEPGLDGKQLRRAWMMRKWCCCKRLDVINGL